MNFVRRIAACAALLALAFVPTGADATIVNVHLDGTLNNVSPSLTTQFLAGQAFHVNFSYDTGIAAQSGGDQFQSTYYALTALSFNTDAYLTASAYSATDSLNTAREVQIDNGVKPGDPNIDDRFGISTSSFDGLNGPTVNGYSLASFFLRFDDSTNSAFSTASSLPVFDPNKFDSNLFGLSFVFSEISASQVDPRATIGGTFNPVVPEPATMSLVALGMGAAGMIRRRRRA